MDLVNTETVSLSVHGSRVSRGHLGLQPNLTKLWPNRAELGVQVVRPGVRFLLESNGKFLNFHQDEIEGRWLNLWVY